MDAPFGITEWQPSKPADREDPALTETDLAVLSAQLRAQTEEIFKHPYDPDCWIRRAETLTKLRFPELATGDAWKAGALCRNSLRLNDRLGGARLGHHMGFWMVEDENDISREVCEGLRERLAASQTRAREVEVENMCSASSPGVGAYLRRPYPWMSGRHRGRGDEILQQANEEFAANRACVGHDGPFCLVERDAFGQGIGEEDTSNLWGVFAARNISEHETILIDESRVWGCNGPGLHGDNESLFRGNRCGIPVHPNTPNEDAKLDMRWIRDHLGGDAAEAILRCRLLLCTIEDGTTHPLDHHLVARMTPQYRRRSEAAFKLEDDIAVPNAALQNFGIDVFADPAYDTWVLFTIFARVANNRVGSPVAETLGPLFGFFNHSCEANLTWCASRDQETLFVVAVRDVRQGEQLFVRYNAQIPSFGLERRREVLADWLDGPCRCTRCEREERERQYSEHVSDHVDGLPD